MIINDTNRWIKAAHVSKFSRIENEESYNLCDVYENAVQRYVENSTVLTSSDLQTCHEFDHHPKYYSIIHQYDLFCSREALLPLTQSFHLLGVLLGGILANFMLKA